MKVYDYRIEEKLNRDTMKPSNGRRGTIEELAQGHLKTGALCGMMLL